MVVGAMGCSGTAEWWLVPWGAVELLNGGFFGQVSTSQLALLKIC
jgi:hypothetical protein